MKVFNLTEFLNEGIENKFLTISEFLEYVKSLSNNWVFTDTETSGLGGAKKQQLTQIGALETTFDYPNFIEKSSFNEKIKLNDQTKKNMNDPNFSKKKFMWGKEKITPTPVKKVLSFTRYGSWEGEYKNEQEVLNLFFKWLEQLNNPILVLQNAKFDMNMFGGRSGVKLPYKVLDTKIFIQYFYIPTLQKLAERDKKYQKVIDDIGTSSRDGGLVSSSMGRIAPTLGVSTKGYHDALVDCRMTYNMTTEMFKFLEEHQDLDIKKYQHERFNVEKKL